MAPHQRYTVADVFLEALAENNVAHVFAVLGSDHPSLIEAYLQRQRLSKPSPKMLHFQHEFTALSAADGYARVTGQPQCVLVHVDVGTAALGQALHNASTGRVPVLIFAGLAPSTVNGELQGSRSEHVQWYQDVPDQKALVAPYARYSNEIKNAEHTKMMVNRAMMMSKTGSPGPVYLTATREVLASSASEEVYEQNVPLGSCRLGGIPEDAVEEISDALLFASDPLVITGYLGRNHDAVKTLIELANLVKGMKVFDSEMRYMSFPADHPAWICHSTGAATAIKEADVVLVLDCDVPWIPTRVRPSPRAQIFHIDLDPRKEKIQLFDLQATATFLADTAQALQQLCKHIKTHPALPSFQETFSTRWANLVHTRKSLPSPLPPSSGEISPSHLFATLPHLLPKSTIYIHDAVTNTPLLNSHLLPTHPGTAYSKGGSGLGWAAPAAIGLQLASNNNNGGETFVCAITGDGAFVFSHPAATFCAQSRLRMPFLTLVVNNGGWKATRFCLEDVHPGGMATGCGDSEIGVELGDDEGPDYVGIAVAASKGKIWGRRVSRGGKELEEALREGARVVMDEGRGAVVEVVVCQ